MKPLVSILLPVYNAEATLESCLRSIWAQSEARWSCLVVDDGSGDRSAEIARRFAETDSRFRLMRGRHLGLVGTLNRGLEACDSPYIARMDADDLMHYRRLELQLKALETEAELAAVGCRVRLFPRAHLRQGIRAYEAWLNSLDGPEMIRRERFIECPLAHPTLFVRGGLFRSFGYREMGWPEDYDLLLRLLEAGHRIGTVPRPLLLWRDGSSRLSKKDPVYSIPSFVDCKAAFLAKSFLAESDRYILCGYGATGKKLLRALRKHGKEPAFIVEIHPARIGSVIQGAPVIRHEELARVPRHPILVSVAHQEPREKARALLDQMGFEELEDYLCVA